MPFARLEGEAIYDARLTATELRVLAAMTLESNYKTGVVSKTSAELAGKLPCGKSATKKARAKLVRLGYLSRRYGSAGWVYVVHRTSTCPGGMEETPAPVDDPGSRTGPGGVTQRTGGGDVQDPLSTIQSSNRGDRGGSADNTFDPADVSDELVRRFGMGAINWTKDTWSRKTTDIGATWRVLQDEFTFEDFKQALKSVKLTKAETSPGRALYAIKEALYRRQGERKDVRSSRLDEIYAEMVRIAQVDRDDPRLRELERQYKVLERVGRDR